SIADTIAVVDTPSVMLAEDSSRDSVDYSFANGLRDTTITLRVRLLHLPDSVPVPTYAVHYTIVHPSPYDNTDSTNAQLVKLGGTVGQLVDTTDANGSTNVGLRITPFTHAFNDSIVVQVSASAPGGLPAGSPITYVRRINIHGARSAAGTRRAERGLHDADCRVEHVDGTRSATVADDAHAPLLRRRRRVRSAERTAGEVRRRVPADLAPHAGNAGSSRRARTPRARYSGRLGHCHPVRESPGVGDRRLRLSHRALHRRPDLPDPPGRAGRVHPRGLRDRRDFRLDTRAGAEDRGHSRIAAQPQVGDCVRRPGWRRRGFRAHRARSARRGQRDTGRRRALSDRRVGRPAGPGGDDHLYVGHDR